MLLARAAPFDAGPHLPLIALIVHVVHAQQTQGSSQACSAARGCEQATPAPQARDAATPGPCSGEGGCGADARHARDLNEAIGRVRAFAAAAAADGRFEGQQDEGDGLGSPPRPDASAEDGSGRAGAPGFTTTFHRAVRPGEQAAAAPAEASGGPSASSRLDPAGLLPADLTVESATRWKPPDRTVTIRLPLTVGNIAALGIFLVLAAFGCIHVLALASRRRCQCRLCAGEYEVKGVLGEGTFGDVLLVRRVRDDEEFVLKKVRVADVSEANEAQAEAKELRGLRHAHIVRYVDDFLHTERDASVKGGVMARRRLFVCIVMERCATDFRVLIDERAEAADPVDQDELVRHFVQMAGALRHCHARQIAHRDVKPGNVFLAADGSVRVGDFGLCRQLRNGVDTYSDEAGTDAYKAPEMLLGGSIDSRRADIFGLGLVLYEMLTLRAVFDREGLVGAQILQRDQQVLQEMAADVPRALYDPALVALMRRMLAKDPAQRPSLEEVLRRKYMRPAVKAAAAPPAAAAAALAAKKSKRRGQARS